MSTKNKDELKKQEKTIRKSLALVFIPIFIVIIFISIIQSNSKNYLEKKYNKIRNNSYSGKITSLLLEKDNGRTKAIVLDNKWEKQVPFFIHEKLNVGDSLFKKSDSDFEFYVFSSKKDTIKRDVNKFYRKKYFDKLNEK